MVIEVEAPGGQHIKQVGIGTKLSETPGSVRTTAPLPGQDTDDVLASLGFDPAAIDSLRQSGAIS
jgi:crotonobetainyl-CoA:carnitine CoA-transferase CaiB-like acyl-CoA transferase